MGTLDSIHCEKAQGWSIHKVFFRHVPHLMDSSPAASPTEKGALEAPLHKLCPRIATVGLMCPELPRAGGTLFQYRSCRRPYLCQPLRLCASLRFCPKHPTYGDADSA